MKIKIFNNSKIITWWFWHCFPINNACKSEWQIRHSNGEQNEHLVMRFSSWATSSRITKNSSQLSCFERQAAIRTEHERNMTAALLIGTFIFVVAGAIGLFSLVNAGFFALGFGTMFVLSIQAQPRTHLTKFWLFLAQRSLCQKKSKFC